MSHNTQVVIFLLDNTVLEEYAPSMCRVKFDVGFRYQFKNLYSSTAQETIVWTPEDLFTQCWSICFRFQSMLRVLKRYQFGYHHTSDANSDPVPGQIITFSSYPGVIHSQDDFYLVVGQPEFGKRKHQLAVLGTAFNSYNRCSVASLNQKEQVTSGFALHCIFK